jgi:thiol-disulfide isomerase/thioredoxin
MTINLNSAISWLKAIATKRKLFTIYILLFTFHFFILSYAQTLSGKIERYKNKPFTIYVHAGDTLWPVQKVTTNSKGEFVFDLNRLNAVYEHIGKKYGLTRHAMLRIELNKERNQYADLLVQTNYNNLNSATQEIKKNEPGGNIQVQLVYNPSQWFNFAADSAVVKTSEVNKSLIAFQKQYRKIQVAETWLLEMSRLFPYADEFSKTLIDEYYKRFKKMEAMAKEYLKTRSQPASKIALAYYRPVVPDYGMPDGERFKIFRENFWTYFDPNDSLFFYSPVLIDKFEEWVYLHHHHKDSIAGLYLDREDIVTGINSFIEKIDRNDQNKQAVLNYVLKKLDADKDDKRLFLAIYDRWLKPEMGSCELQSEEAKKWHDKANLYRDVQIGSLAPDFDIVPGMLRMHQVPAEYTLLVFWASWCPHCVQEIPKIKAFLGNYAGKEKIHPIFISLDEDDTSWRSFIEKAGLTNYIHVCEYKGWKSDVVKRYNVYATPTLILLDKNKRIVLKPLFIEQVEKYIQ